MNIEVKISKSRISYKTAMKVLDKRVNELKAGKGKELIWVLEHPTTYTSGIRSNINEILDKKIKIINTNKKNRITDFCSDMLLKIFIIIIYIPFNLFQGKYGAPARI